jgi:uncharacterized protein GlcG (DUF336 family)
MKLTPIARLAGIAISLLAALASPWAIAQAPRTERNMGLELAQAIALEAVANCQKSGYNVTATVVDRAGQVRAQLRGDLAGPHTINTSFRKAYMAASTRNNTSATVDNVQKNPASAGIGSIENFILLGGGIPIRSGNEVIGAVGVGGAPGGHLDDVCAQAGIDKVKDKL